PVPRSDLRLDTPPRPEVELAVDDRVAPRLEHNAEVLPPRWMPEPPSAQLDQILASVDEPVHVEQPEVCRAQIDRHALGIASAVELLRHVLEAQDPSLAAVEDDGIVPVKLGEDVVSGAALAPAVR